jgi:CelD/BcsL family acetyltransferase involved in cellulose biosynthesis
MVQSAYQNDAFDYAVIGPGWIFGPVTATVDDSAALTVQQATGGEVVCLPGYNASAGGGC